MLNFHEGQDDQFLHVLDNFEHCVTYIDRLVYTFPQGGGYKYDVKVIHIYLVVHHGEGSLLIFSHSKGSLQCFRGP